jgi:hypothetical protein
MQAPKPPHRRVDAARLCMHQPRRCERRQPGEVDVAVVVRVVPRDVAGQHAAVGGVDVACDEGDCGGR